MKYFQLSVLMAVTALVTSDAWAQYGLYGSPGVVSLPREHSAATFAARDSDPGNPSAVTRPQSPRLSVTALNPAPPARENPAPLKGSGQPAAGVVDQMLGEACCGWLSPWGNASTCGSFGQVVATVDECGTCAPCFQPRWYASVSALYMTRDEPDPLWTTYEENDQSNLISGSVPVDWVGGGEVRIGRRFGGASGCTTGCDIGCGSVCGSGCCWTLEGVYWTLESRTGTDIRRVPGSLVGGLMNFNDVSYFRPALAGLSPDDLFHDAEEHRVSRHDEMYNLELNLIGCSPCPDPCRPFQMNWSIGARLFRFDEDWRLASLDEGGVAFGIDPTLEGYLDDNISNTLIGAQIAGDLSYRVCNWSLFFRPKVGIYNNRIKNRFAAYRGDGERFAPDFAGNPGFPVESTTDTVSFLTEFDTGVEWHFHPQWSTHVGYRATIVTGIGLTEDQIPHYLVDTPIIADIDHNGQLILHGGYAGITYLF